MHGYLTCISLSLYFSCIHVFLPNHFEAIHNILFLVPSWALGTVPSLTQALTSQAGHTKGSSINYIIYAPGGRGGVEPFIHFYCVLHEKMGVGGPNSM